MRSSPDGPKCVFKGKPCPKSNEGKDGCAQWIAMHRADGTENWACLFEWQVIKLCEVNNELESLHTALNESRNEQAETNRSFINIKALEMSLNTPPGHPMLPKLNGD